MKVTRNQAISTILIFIIALIISLIEELTVNTKIILLIILAIIVIIILIFNIIRSKIREFRKIRRLKKVVEIEIEAIRKGKDSIISTGNLDYIHEHRDKFKKIEGLNDVFFKYFIDKQVLFAKNIMKINEDKKKREVERYKKLFKK